VRKKWLLLAVVGFLLTGCLTPVRTPNIAKYTLTAYSNPQASTRYSHATLFVTIPTASPDYQTKQMLYTEGNIYQLRAFAKNQWIAPPALLLQPLIVQNLRDTGYFRAVVASPQTALTDWRLDTQLLALRQDFFLSGSQVCLILQAQIVNSGTNKVLAQRRFVSIVNAPTRNPEGGVIAANQATQHTLQQLARFVVNTLERSSF
jgi:cholesterol transport system auxiliary component